MPAAANPTLPIRTMQVTVGTATQTILTDSRGFSLYFYVPDTQTKSACTDSCVNTWPPLLAPTASGDVQSNASLPGKLTVQQTANGNQVEYNGHLLYTYISDSGPSIVTGNGVNSWYVATPDLKPPTAVSYIVGEMFYDVTEGSRHSCEQRSEPFLMYSSLVQC